MGERCQVDRGAVRPAVLRPALLRPALLRPALLRPVLMRPAVCGPTGCIDAVAVDAVALRREAEAALRAILDDITDAAATGAIIVEGHTDSDGTEARNQGLSERRAGRVAAWLVEEGGIDASRIETIGLGQTSPAATNDTEEGRQQNRRVVIGVDR